MSSIVISGDTSGTITIAAPAVSGTTTLTLPVQTGTVMVNGPAFSAYRTGTQGGFASATYTKVSVQTEVFDTNSNYDNATNYRFTPTVAGYYQFNAAVVATGTTLNYLQAVLVKNGSAPGFTGSYVTTASGEGGSSVSALIYLNGSTDYVELYAYAQVTGTFTIYGGSQPQSQTFFNGALVRSA
jgi:hypothetical protein